MTRIVLFFLLCCSACKTLRDPRTGASLGEQGGNMLGSVIGSAAGNAEAGSMIGGSLGGATGEALLKTVEREAELLRQTMPGARVTRTNDSILVEVNALKLFDPNKASLSANGTKEIQPLIAVLQDYRDTKVTVLAHTDKRGTIRQNQVFTDKRSAAIAKHLIEKGLSEKRISSRGLGESMAKAETDAAARAANRRIEFILTR